MAQTLQTRLNGTGRKLSKRRAAVIEAMDECREIAVEAYEAGLTEVEIAERLGVDRARTLRPWLGK